MAAPPSRDRPLRQRCRGAGELPRRGNADRWCGGQYNEPGARSLFRVGCRRVRSHRFAQRRQFARRLRRRHSRRGAADAAVDERAETMKCVILAGGLGTRLAEETEVRPKPMVEIGGRPILWHIMKHYSGHGFNEFLVALGYKSEVVKRYFLDYANVAGSPTVGLARGQGQSPQRHGRGWTAHR